MSWFLSYHLTMILIVGTNMIVQITALIKALIQNIESNRFPSYLFSLAVGCWLELMYHILMVNRDTPNNNYMFVLKYYLNTLATTITMVTLWYWQNRTYGSPKRKRVFMIVAVITCITTMLTGVHIFVGIGWEIGYRIFSGSMIIFMLLYLAVSIALYILYNHEHMIRRILIVIAIAIVIIGLYLWSAIAVNQMVLNPVLWFIHDGILTIIRIGISALIAIGRFRRQTDRLL